MSLLSPHNLLVETRRVKTLYSFAITISALEESFGMWILEGYDQYLPFITKNSRVPEAFFVYFLSLLLAYISLLKKSGIDQYSFLIRSI